MGFLSKAISASHSNKSVTIVPNGALLTGDLMIEGALHLNGEFDGLLDTQGSLVIGRGGLFKGRARAHEVIITGRFDGELHCDRLHILKGGVFSGRVACEQFHLEDKSEFLGQRIYPGMEAKVLDEALELLEQPLPKRSELTLDNLMESLPTQVSLKRSNDD